MSEYIVIIGAGILGLTAALRIQDLIHAQGLPYKLIIIAKEFPSSPSSIQPSPNYASMHAGAHVRPILALTPQLAREARWLKYTCNVFAEQVATQPWLGVTQVPGVEYFENPSPEIQSLDAATFMTQSGLQGFRRIDEHTLPRGVKLGYEYTTYCINSPIYCMALLRKFILNGGSIMTADVKCEEEAAAAAVAPAARLVINASGMGFGDKACFPTRGQIALTNIPAEKTITRQNADGTWSFVIPRGFDGGTIVGGTKEAGEWDARPDQRTRATLAKSMRELALLSSSSMTEGKHQYLTTSQTPSYEILQDVVGRRPTRDGGLRLEVERRTLPQSSQTQSASDRQAKILVIVHAYGAGGRGYEISWGVAEEVKDLVTGVLRDEGLTRQAGSVWELGKILPST
ncbi:hypothetical protein PV08_11683 [Exophiala spinifera]|uniref:FAD dependent oxidoreductase domain-containing protein n=1 Tax=Exophiala spinifera TaxID=91928 RepID=A0A0D1ZA62_9EURO|nr:uncharacterized protein PV08_11683 [Exophiala spinifera]KIW09907.1 hypothetical protein PV08_11683 [Exophiala spinifera]